MINVNLKYLWIIAALFMALGSARAEKLEETDVFCERADDPNPPNPNCVSTRSFVDKVLKSDEVVIVMATARWCGICQRFERDLPNVMKEFQGKKLRFYGINYDQNSAFLKDVFHVEYLPSIHVFEGGERRWKFSRIPGSVGAAVRDFGYALEAVENRSYRVDKYPTLLEDASKDPLAEKILKYRAE